MISVIMSVYKEPESYLRLAIESILKQTEQNIEFIIVLDDPRNENAKRVLEEYAQADGRIKLLFNDKNIGLTRSLNKGLKLSKGEYIARMDADDISERERLEKQIKYLTDENLDLIGCSLRRISEDGVVNGLTNPSYKPECITKLLKYDDCVPHPSWFVKRCVYETLNGYRNINCCEDYDFLLRALKHGFRIGICGEVLLNYRINTKGISRTNSLRQMLTADYLRHGIKKLDEIEQEEIELWLKGKISDKKNKNYEKSLILLNKLIEEIKSGRYYLLVKLPQIIFLSAYSLNNIYKIIMMQFIKRKYSILYK